MEAPPSPLSSRAKPRDLQCALRPSRILRIKPQPPNRSVGQWRDLLFIICSIEFEWKRRPPFVIPTEASGARACFSLHSQTNLHWKRHPPLCHPERSRGIRGSPPANESPRQSPGRPQIATPPFPFIHGFHSYPPHRGPTALFEPPPGRSLNSGASTDQPRPGQCQSKRP